jgi:protein phosphatase
MRNCEQVIQEKKSESKQYSNMCTTIAGCLFYDDCTIIFHSGDSRVYRYDKWGLSKLTIDHSAVQKMIDIGQITENESQTSPNRNVINRCIGINGLPPEIRVINSAIRPTEQYLICSDGLWDVLSTEQIEEVLSNDIPIYEKVDALINSTLEQGANDNISVCIISCNHKLIESVD